jgi:hypothetical protein
LGTVVIFGLFSYSIFLTHSRQLFASMITTMKEEVLESLPPSADPQERRVAQSFDALSGVNRAGRLRIVQMGRLNWVYIRAISDGTITEQEVDGLLEEIRGILREATPVRRL